MLSVSVALQNHSYIPSVNVTTVENVANKPSVKSTVLFAMLSMYRVAFVKLAEPN